METRKPVVAGQFYSGSSEGCLAEIIQCLADGPCVAKLPAKISGGIVPHAGWTFSGDLAGSVFSAIREVDGEVDTFVIFGAVHRYIGGDAAVYDRGSWLTPLGEIEIDEELAGRIVAGSLAVSDLESHRSEHSIEVQVPFIQHMFSGAKIVPVMVPPVVGAVELGRQIGEIVSAAVGKKIVCIASTDLTHYGPRYGFCPAGVGADGIKWARDVNDAEFIELALKMKAQKLLVTAEENTSACGPGAAAALVAAMKELGKTEGVLLAHTHSNDVMIRKYGQSSDESVGYAAIVF